MSALAEGVDTVGTMATPSFLAARRAVTEHPLLARPLDADEARRFMAHHVFAVWDFMTLLKRLQLDLTGTRLPWRPPADREAARLINEIVLGEESDEDGAGGHASHFEVYFAVMSEVGADRRPIDLFVGALERGADPLVALAESGAPRPAEAFVRHTLALALDPRTPTAAVAAAFFHGREAIVPAMFRQLLVSLDATEASASRLRWYLARHVEVDEGAHGPMAEQLLARLCVSVELAEAADRAAVDALAARRALWDGVLAALTSPARAETVVR